MHVRPTYAISNKNITGKENPSPKISDRQNVELPDESKKGIKDNNPNLWNSFTLGHYRGIAWKAFRRTIRLDELMPLHSHYTSAYCWEQFANRWPTRQKRNKIGVNDNCKAHSSSDAACFGSGNSSTCSQSITWGLTRPLWGLILYTSILQLLHELSRLSLVYILSEMLRFISSDEPDTEGYKLCGALFASVMFSTIMFYSIKYWSASGAVQIRSSLLAAIYRKCLVASNGSSSKFTDGDVMNMVAGDANVVYQFGRQATMLWGYATRIIMSLVILWVCLGPSCLVGLVVITAGIPATKVISDAITRSQRQFMSEKDKELDLLTEVISGIKVVKFNAWEIPFMKKLRNIRGQERGHIRSVLLNQSLMFFLWNCMPFLVIAAMFAAYVFINADNILTPEQAFVTLIILGLIQYPLKAIPGFISMMLGAANSLERIRNFLLSKDIHLGGITGYVKNGEDIRFENASFSWGDGTRTISGLNLTITEGELVAVVGKVGSGKSSLLSAILGEMEKLEGTVDVRKVPIAYVPQQAWIQNETVKGNILLALTFDRPWYEAVIEKCCLAPDLKMFPAGDNTEIGAKGINLSGGQKQRVSMARAVYQKAKMYLLDDPLSGVDAHVSSDLFENVIGPRGLLRDCTRILVTHSTYVLPFVDRIVILEDGKITHTGTYEEILKMDIRLKQFLLEQKEDPIKVEINPLCSAWDGSCGANNSFKTTDKLPSDKAHEGKGILIEKEFMEVGDIKWSVYTRLIRKSGRFTLLGALCGFVAFYSIDVNLSIWLAKWTKDGVRLLNSFNMTTADLQHARGNLSDELLDEIATSSWHHMWIYLSIGSGGILSLIIAEFFLGLGCISVSSALHSDMLWSIVRAPMSFFDVTPLGRIINTFGSDMSILDVELFSRLDHWLAAIFRATFAMALICIKIPLFVVFALPTTVISLFMQKMNVKVSHQFRRLQSTTQSLILNHFSEVLDGITSIRAYKVEDHFIKECQRRIDINQNCCLHFDGVIGWSGIRSDLVIALAVSIACGLIVYCRHQLDATSTGLILVYALSISPNLVWIFFMSIELQDAFIAAERVEQYTKIKEEAVWTREDGSKFAGDWPQAGDVEFADYSTKYREGMDLVLKDINLRIRCGEKVGVVGRTGAGKSSLALALFRILEATSGRIVIDKVDTSLLGLHELRSRITMIPQEPVLFRGTVRSNLDPHGFYTDEQIYDALERAHLNKAQFSLDHEITRGGSNISVGERQLVCLARALLQKPKIILLDEATAAVDMETDFLVQETIRRDFSSSTVITIAHRLNTVLDYDTIVVFSEGQIVESGSPQQLLVNQNSHFYLMAKDAGLV